MMQTLEIVFSSNDILNPFIDTRSKKYIAVFHRTVKLSLNLALVELGSRLSSPQ